MKDEMSDFNGQWFEIFRAGDYGDKGSYTTEDVDKFVTNYNPAQHEAPLVIGHPENDKPAYGWVEALKNVGGVLMAKAKQVAPEFEELVKAGRFKKRSVGFYRTEDGPALRHVGFLGAMPPEVKGLKDLALCEFSDGEFVEFISGEEEVDKEQIKKTVAETVKEFFSELFGNKGQAQAAADPALEAKFNELQTKFEAKVAELTTKLQESEKKQQTAATANLAEDAVNKLKADRKWIPAFDAMGVPQIFAELAKSEAKLTFGEGDKKTEKSPLQVFGEFLGGVGKIVPEGEMTRAASAGGQGGKVIAFNESKGISLSEDSVAFDEAVQQYMKEHKDVPHGQAMRIVRSQLFQAKDGGASAGAV